MIEVIIAYMKKNKEEISNGMVECTKPKITSIEALKVHEKEHLGPGVFSF